MKTPEEIKKGLECCAENCNAESCGNTCSYRYGVCYPDSNIEVRRDALAYIQQLEAERDAAVDAMPRWIPMEARLPPIGEVLISHCGHVCITWHHGQGKFETGSRVMLVYGIHDITHWMPLPEPPEEE